MKYLIHTSKADAESFSRAVRLRVYPNPEPQCHRDAPFLFSVVTKEGTSTAAVAVPDTMVGMLTEDEQLELVDSLPAELEPEEEQF